MSRIKCILAINKPEIENWMHGTSREGNLAKVPIWEEVEIVDILQQPKDIIASIENNYPSIVFISNTCGELESIKMTLKRCKQFYSDVRIVLLLSSNTPENTHSAQELIYYCVDNKITSDLVLKVTALTIQKSLFTTMTYEQAADFKDPNFVPSPSIPEKSVTPLSNDEQTDTDTLPKKRQLSDFLPKKKPVQDTDQQEQLGREEKEHEAREESARLERESKERLEREDQERAEREQQMRAERERQAREEQVREEQARVVQEEKARVQKEEQALVQRQEQERIQREEQARIQKEEQEHEDRTNILKEQQERIQREEHARVQQEEQERAEHEERARVRQEEQARAEHEERARVRQEEQARAEREEKEKQAIQNVSTPSSAPSETSGGSSKLGDMLKKNKNVIRMDQNDQSAQKDQPQFPYISGQVPTIQINPDVSTSRGPSQFVNQKVVTFWSPKAIGKTTILSNMAVQAAKLGIKTVTADLNIFTHDLGAYFGLPRKTPGLEQLIGRYAINEDSVQSLIQNKCGVDIIPTGMERARYDLTVEKHEVDNLIHTLTRRMDYTLILVDICNIMDEMAAATTLKSSDVVYLVVDQNRSFLEDINNSLIFAEEQLEIPRSKFRLIINNYVARCDMSQSRIESFLKMQAIAVIPSDRFGHIQAVNYGKPYCTTKTEDAPLWNSLVANAIGKDIEEKQGVLSKFGKMFK